MSAYFRANFGLSACEKTSQKLEKNVLQTQADSILPVIFQKRKHSENRWQTEMNERQWNPHPQHLAVVLSIIKILGADVWWFRTKGSANSEALSNS